jgi:hypothetical protein
MFGLCKYKDLFGKLNTGIHSYKIFNISVLDFGVTAIAAYFIAWFLGTPYLPTLGIFFLFGILVHRLFCVRTTIDKFLFPNAKDS